MSEYKFVWKGKDPTGKLRSERVVAENAQNARQQLTNAGWTELELVMDEVCAVSSEIHTLEGGKQREELFENADKEVAYFHGKYEGLIGPWLKAMWNARLAGLVALGFIGFGIYGENTKFVAIGVSLAALFVLLFPAIHVVFSGLSSDYARLNRAKVWARHEEILDCVERLRRKRRWLRMGVSEVELVRCQAQALAGMGKLDMAVATFMRFENDPKIERWLYLSMLASIYDVAKAHEQSLELRKQAAAAKPESSATWIDLASGHVRGLNQPAEARAALAQAEKLEITGLGKAYLPFLRGIICWREKNSFEARKELETALESLQTFAHNELVEGLFLLTKAHLCAVHRALGNSAEAKKLLEQVEKFLVVQKEDELLAACRGEVA